MNKEFVPYELALKLKQLGFDEPCFGYYNELGNFTLEIDKVNSSCNKLGMHGKYCTAPLKQQCLRWFRDKYNLNGILNHYPNTKLWDFSVHNLEWNGKEFIEHVRKEDRSVKYSTYEEAEDACILKLISIVKEQNNEK